MPLNIIVTEIVFTKVWSLKGSIAKLCKFEIVLFTGRSEIEILLGGQLREPKFPETGSSVFSLREALFTFVGKTKTDVPCVS